MNRAKPGMVRKSKPFAARVRRVLTCVKVRRRGNAIVTPMAVASLPLRTSRLADDAQGLATGTLLAAFGVFLLQQAGLVPGGTVGIALLLHYASGVDLGATLFLVNLPFYALAWLRLGKAFTLRTALAVSLLAALSWWLPRAIAVQQVEGVLAAVLGGLLCGVGMLILFRHGASLGGLNVLVLRLHDRFGWSTGKVQLAFDAAIVLAGGWLTGDPRRLGLSVLAVATLNLVLVWNHRKGRHQPA
jgi:uncharacterized membrane-anchored protein YitT (DUF2179 family)